MTNQSWKGRERRKHARVRVAYEIRLKVLVGQKGASPASGITVNLSRGGVLAKVNQPIALGARCQIHFVGGGDRLRPESTSGVVRRVSRGRGSHIVAIQFDRPLESLLVADTAWAKPRMKM